MQRSSERRSFLLANIIYPRPRLSLGVKSISYSPQNTSDIYLIYTQKIWKASTESRLILPRAIPCHTCPAPFTMAVIWIEPLHALHVQKEVLIPSMKSGVHNKTNVVIFPIRITQIPVWMLSLNQSSQKTSTGCFYSLDNSQHLTIQNDFIVRPWEFHTILFSRVGYVYNFL